MASPASDRPTGGQKVGSTSRRRVGWATLSAAVLLAVIVTAGVLVGRSENGTNVAATASPTQPLASRGSTTPTGPTHTNTDGAKTTSPTQPHTGHGSTAHKSHDSTTPTGHASTAPTKEKKRHEQRKPKFMGAAHVLLKNATTNLCADLPDFGKGTANGPVNQYPCTMGDADNQVWSLGVLEGDKGPGGTSLFQIRNDKDNYCMDLPDHGAKSIGTKVGEYLCRPSTADNQIWYPTPTHHGDGEYLIHNLASHGLCLGVSGRSQAQKNAQLEIHECGEGDAWSWPQGG